MNFWSTEDVDDVVLRLLDVEDLRLFLKYILVDRLIDLSDVWLVLIYDREYCDLV